MQLNAIDKTGLQCREIADQPISIKIHQINRKKKIN